MPYCPQCGQPCSVSLTHCPECSRDETPDESAFPDLKSTGLAGFGGEGCQRVAIARFQNGAEAGYFADELTRESGVETEVLARERFDAVHAAWSVDYMLLVEKPHAENAARLLQSLVEASGDELGEEASEVSGCSDLPGGVWVPLILTLAAGSIACFGIERLDRPARPPALVVGDRREPPELWQVLTATKGVWTQKLEGGPGVRHLTLDPDKHSARLEEDHDGDGQVDREWEFSWKKR